MHCFGKLLEKIMLFIYETRCFLPNSFKWLCVYFCVALQSSDNWFDNLLLEFRMTQYIGKSVIHFSDNSVTIQ